MSLAFSSFPLFSQLVTSLQRPTTLLSRPSHGQVFPKRSPRSYVHPFHCLPQGVDYARAPSVPDQSRASKALGEERRALGSSGVRLPPSLFIQRCLLVPTPPFARFPRTLARFGAAVTHRPSRAVHFSRGCRQGRARHGGR